jgi:hypothetical protein
MSAPHDAPTLAQLVEAVREFVEHDLSAIGGAGDARLRFHARVAVNVLRMVERELALGPRQAAEHAERLIRLGAADDSDLARGIRDGRYDGRIDELLGELREAVRAKLEVANPPYAG